MSNEVQNELASSINAVANHSFVFNLSKSILKFKRLKPTKIIPISYARRWFEKSSHSERSSAGIGTE